MVLKYTAALTIPVVTGILVDCIAYVVKEDAEHVDDVGDYMDDDHALIEKTIKFIPNPLALV